MTTATDAAKPKTYVRFSLTQRIEHAIQLTAFTGLALTGLPQKFAQAPISEAMIAVMGGIEFVRVVHRVFATALMLQVIYHLIRAGHLLFVLRRPPYMLPLISDFTDMVKKVGYNLGIRKENPRMPRFNFEEKLEYWALAWGSVVMILTGFMLWNPIATTRFLPGEYIPAAKAAHGAEAVLAVLAIIIWHFYNVHLKQFNPSMFTGKIGQEAMEEDHRAELDDIEAGRLPVLPTPEAYRKRMRVFVPVALILALVLGGGVVWFITFEETAIETIPPYEIEVVPPELSVSE